MAPPALGTEMSLVPYSSQESNEVVLRFNSALVVYDQSRNQLALRAAPPPNDVDFTECPYCHRPLREEYPERAEQGRQESDPNVDVGFVSPEYFRMLRDHETGADDLAAPPPSPRRRLTRPIDSGSGSSPVSAANAEFVSSSPTSSQGISAAALSPNYFQRFFVEEKVLGKGGKGVVLLVRHLLDGVSLGYFACKRVPVGDDHQWLEKVLVEVQLLQHLSHQNLVSYRHVWLEDVKLSNFGPSVPCAFILQQYCNAGDLHQYIFSATTSSTTQQLKERLRRRSKGHLDVSQEMCGARRLQFEEIYSFFKGITSGLNHLHENGFIHRDLKPSNCLLHDTGNELRVLVSDFGEAQKESMTRRSTGATGTISYCAPEVLRPEYPGGPLGEFTAKSDIFSLGMILYFMCFGRLPYANANNLEEDEDLEQLREEISAWSGFDDKKKVRSDLPDQLYKFLKRLLSLDPIDRPSAEDILRGITSGGALNKDSPPGHAHSGFFQELRSGSRISPVETPTPSTPTANWTGGGRRIPATGSSGFAKPTASKLRTRSFKDDGFEAPSSSDDLEPMSAATETHDSSLMIRKRGLPTSPGTSPYRAPPTQLLPSPDRPESGILSSRYLITAYVVIKPLLFILKLFSIFHSCSPLASNPWVSYPLICLAVLDIINVSDDSSRHITLALSLAHVVLLLTAARYNVLCLSRESIFTL
ncbi:MAG: putative serine/threonine-protein kinase iks1 [Sclerophora amabilis]|nr:MAG: putative serine/threonine-protein kinase iks1 [Sclerophora amabilis]